MTSSPQPQVISQAARALGLAAFLALVVAMVAQTRADVDLWGHVLFGADIIETRTLPSDDPYSFTSDRAWINHEWLSEIVMALAWRTGGAPGLVILKLACIVTALVLMAGTLTRRGVTAHPRFVLVGLSLLGILPRVGHVRPQLFSVVLFAALMRIFAQSEMGSVRSLLWTIPVVGLWANFHGGWLVGVGTVALWCAGTAFALRSDPRRAVFALACGLGATVSTLANPYGAGLWKFLIETVRFGREAIREWGPAWTDPATLIVWTIFALIVIAACRSTSRPPNPATLVIPIVWGLAALRVGRLDAFFAMSVIGMLSGPVSALFQETRRVQAPLSRAWLTGAVAAAAVLVATIGPAREGFTCIGLLTPRWPEPAAVEFMRQRQLSGRLVTYFDWGEYAIWHLAPSLKVSMDGRRETVYSDAAITGHLGLYAGTREGLEYAREVDADYVWLPRTLPAVKALQQGGWTSVFEGPHSILLFRSSRYEKGAAAPFSVAAVTSGRCFPGP